MPITCITERVTSNLPIVSFNTENLSIPSDICLANPDFNKSRPVDLLLGAEVFWDLLCDDRRRLSNPSLFLTKTLLGWVVGGASYNLESSGRSGNRVANLAIKDESDELQRVMEKFWIQEEIPESKKKWFKEEIECEEQFRNTYMRDPSEGRFVVKLPFKKGNVELRDSSGVALRRFLSLERRFKRDRKLKDLYAMQELIQSNIVERAPEGEVAHNTTYYLPHSGIVKEARQKVKIRIVYDGWAKSTNRLSLNDNLMTGPNLQTELFSLLIRFKMHQIAFSFDLEKMFLQAKINPEDTNYQRFFW
ncbi:uncharacterized protein LOC108735897 [Agrilus planipennis]|uniref:Uncharacterized protein LOC108735897 n=1 Tax=Agrilus planipennis TaxID=224129 RepID=A0A1W4WI56_AGRPL|nr:uncharacterized protein LOC108735897 [Agrilus planipennis]